MTQKVSAVLLVLTLGSVTSSAQVLGTFSWQLQPYCNRVSGTVTQVGGVYRLDAVDDMCGGATVVPVRGSISPNPNGTLSVGLEHVAPSGIALHTTATISLPSASGTWTDDQGHSGGFVLGGAIAGSPRPLPSTALPDGSVTTAKLAPDAVDGARIAPGAVGAADVNSSEVQRRVTGVCAAGELMTAVNADGSVSCAAPPTGGGGDITAVLAGTGLTGGATTGNATLAVAFGGDGAQNAVARADHLHSVPGNLLNTRVGNGALAVSTGTSNTALGADALHLNSTGQSNTAVGHGALASNLAGEWNVGVGRNALGIATASNNVGVGTGALFTASGCCNVAVGTNAMSSATTTVVSVAVGHQALATAATATDNVAVGGFAMAQATGGGNVAVGSSALRVTTAQFNTAVGGSALRQNTTGGASVAVGSGALSASTTGNNNTAVGKDALRDLTTGSDNLAMGMNAGSLLTSGSGNVYVGSTGAFSESNTMRLGASQTATYVAGVSGQTASGDPVHVLFNGKLGTITSSRRFKQEIETLAGETAHRLQALRPVTFRYRPEYDDGQRTLQFGLIAEEVDEVLPELVARDPDGQVRTVRYQFLVPMLLAEVQRLERERTAMSAALAAQAAAIDELRAAMAGRVPRDR